MSTPNRRTRHIDIKYYYFREYAEQGIVKPQYTSTKEMLADNFIKALDRLKFTSFAAFIGLYG